MVKGLSLGVGCGFAHEGLVCLGMNDENAFMGSGPVHEGRGPWRVFLSPTGELERFPAQPPYVQVAVDAVLCAGHTPSDGEERFTS